MSLLFNRNSGFVYKTPCFIETAGSAIPAGDIYAGFEIKEERLELCKKFFSCCQGSGLNSSCSDDLTYICKINSNLSRVRQIFSKMAAEYNLTLGDCLKEKKYDFWQEAVATMLQYNDHSCPNIGLQFVRSGGGPSALWQLAVFSSFWLSVDVDVLGFNRYCETRDELFTKMRKPPKVLFITDVSKLWDEERASIFEHLLNYCEKSEIFCWIDFIDTKTFLSEKRYGARSSFSNRLRELSLKHPSHPLSEKGKSLLSSLTIEAKRGF